MSVWTAMRLEDLNQVIALSKAVHPELPESRITQEQRLITFPQGCLVLRDGADIGGYAFAHPIRHGMPPALDTAPDQILPDADELYLHDFVVSPRMRGGGHAAKGIGALLLLGDDFASTALISVYGTAHFWGKFGFTPFAAVPTEKLMSYGVDALYMIRRNVGRITTE